MIPPNFVLLSWIPIVLYLCRWLPAQRAVVLAFIVAFQFLPQFQIVLPALIPFTKMAATTYGIVMGTILFDAQRLKSFRLGWIDLPVILWCLCPIASSIENDLGIFDGLKNVFRQTVVWGAPYLVGRIYLSDAPGVRKLAVGSFIGGLVYIPFCLVESVMGPLLHEKVYGFNAVSDWSQARRWGGWRPVVFTEHGLQLGIWLMAAALIGIWLWKSGTLKKVGGVPMKALVPILFVVFLNSRSTGAWLLMVMGLLILFCTRWFRSPALLIALIGLMGFYLYIASSGLFSGDQIVDFVATYFDRDRAASLEFRFMNEEPLADKARERIWFGWGSDGRNRIFSPINGQDISVTDSLWIIVFGERGVVGLACWFLTLLTPVLAFAKHVPAYLWSHPKIAPAAVLSVVVALFTFDCLLNAMTNPLFTIAAGCLAGFVSKYADQRSPGTPVAVADQYLPQKRPSY